MQRPETVRTVIGIGKAQVEQHAPHSGRQRRRGLGKVAHPLDRPVDSGLEQEFGDQEGVALVVLDEQQGSETIGRGAGVSPDAGAGLQPDHPHPPMSWTP